MSQLAVESPLPVVPAGVLGNPPAADMGAAAAFALAIQLAMGVVSATPAAVAEDGAEDGTGPTDATADPATGDGDEGTTDGATEAGVTLAALLVPALVPAVAPALVPAATSTDVPAKLADVATTPTNREAVGAAALSPAGDAPLATTVTSDQTTTVATDPSADPAATAATAPASPSGEATAAAPTAPDTTQAPVLTTAPTTAPTATVSPVATVAGPVDAPAAPAPRPVAAQVIPEVTKLFTNGEGVHRVTLELNPKALGEVRVVLTVRHGDVHVRLAAGSEARAALALSSGDLNRALEHIGIKEHRLTLAELPGVTASAATQTHSDTTESRQQHAPFTGRFDTEHHHDSRQPRMGDGSTATDGTDHDHGSRTRGDRSIHEVSHVPSRGGVDLRM